MPFGVVLLLAEKVPWVGWWAPHPGDPRLEVDVCLPPERTDRGWRFVDLELDVFHHRGTGRVTIEDRDEFEEACEAGAIDAETARLAERTALEMAAVLTRARAEWIGRGWELLADRSLPRHGGAS